jgi:hypothetical protein
MYIKSFYQEYTAQSYLTRSLMYFFFGLCFSVLLGIILWNTNPFPLSILFSPLPIVPGIIFTVRRVRWVLIRLELSNQLGLSSTDSIDEDTLNVRLNMILGDESWCLKQAELARQIESRLPVGGDADDERYITRTALGVYAEKIRNQADYAQAKFQRVKKLLTDDAAYFRTYGSMMPRGGI